MLISAVAVVAILVGGAIGYRYTNKKLNKRLSDAEKKAEQIHTDNQADIKKQVNKIEQKFANEIQEYQEDEKQDAAEQLAENETRKEHLDIREKSIGNLGTRLDKLADTLDKRQADLQNLQAEIDGFRQTAADLQTEKENNVFEKSGLTRSQAKQMVLQNTKATLKRDYDLDVKENHDAMVLNAAKDARNIMIEALQNGPVDVPRDHIERNITIPDENVRNKITGKNEQRLRLIETLTGVDLIFNPEAEDVLIISTSDPIRREIARTSINELITARQINNSVIENVVASTQQHIMDDLRVYGENTCSSLHIGWVHPDLMKLIGRLRFRTSYGQNVLQHSVEVAELCGLMAAELGLDVPMAKRAGLLHDIGKTIDREVNGTHVELGIKIAEAYGEKPEIIDAIAASHGDIDSDNSMAILVRVGDSMSGSRPGARSESVEEYINRLKGLEKIANSHPGVKESYAIQAGREIRIIVDPRKVDESQSAELTGEVSNQIQDELTYPGKIKVTTIRKLKAVQYVGGKPNAHKKHAKQ